MILERTFRGIDLSREPEDLAEGFLQVADNASLDGADVLTRPGLTAQLTSPVNPLFAYTPLAEIPGTPTRAILCSAANLYYWGGGSSLTSVGSVSSPSAAQIALLGNAGYLVDGTVNSLQRITLDTSAVPTAIAAISQLNRPDQAAVIMGNRVINAVGPSTWAVDALTGANTNLAQNPRFNGADSTGSNLGNYWKVWAGTPKCYDNGTVSALPALAAGEKWLRLDDPGDVACLAKSSTGSTSPYTDNGYATNANWLTGSSDYYRYCKRFRFKCRVISVGPASKAASARIQFFDTSVVPGDSTMPIYEANVTLDPLAEGKDHYVTSDIDLTDLVLGNIGYIRLFLLPNPASTVTSDGPYVTDISLMALHPYWDKPSVAPSEAGFLPINEDKTLLKGLMLACALGSTTDLSKMDAVGFTTTTPIGFDPAPQVQLRLMDDSNNVWSAPDTAPLAPSMEWDISSCPSAIRSRAYKVALVFTEDSNVGTPAVTRTVSATRCSLYINDFIEPGNLLAGHEYWYAVTELDDNGDSTLVDVILSDGSTPTRSVQAATGSRMATLTIAAKKNTGADYLLLWRFGGPYFAPQGDQSLPSGRLVAMLPWGSSVSYGADANKPASPQSGFPRVFGNPYVSWDNSTRVLVDNTPDSWLGGAELYQHGREQAPAKADAIAAWDNRLWLGYGADIYGSWEIDPANPAGVYWTRVALPVSNDPEAPAKGYFARLALQPGDSIKRLVPVGGESGAAMLVLTKRTAFVLTRGGRGQERWVVRELVGDDVRGVVGIRAATVFEDAVWWMSDRGLLMWRPGMSGPKRVGDQVRRLLPGISPSMTYALAALNEVCLVGTPHYLYLAVPETSLDSSPSTVLVWHQREQGWTRWKNLSIVGGAGEVLAGRDGQLWLIGGSGDTTSAGGSLSAVTLTVQTRRVGDGSMFQQVGRLFCGVNVPGGSPASVGLSVLGDGANPASVTQSMSGESVVWVRVPGTAAGRKHDVSLSVASTERVRVRGLGLETFPARRI